MTFRFRGRRAASATIAVLALLVAGCGGGEDEPEAPKADNGSLRDDLVVGIGEQNTAMFADPNFAALKLKDARLVVSYDTVAVRFERQIVDTWLAEAKRTGVRPFITFGHSRVNPKKLPSVAEFRSAFRAFRERYPDVDTYAPWNEINHASQPTASSPERAAQYFDVVAKECEDCTVLAGDVLDQPGMTRYLAAYRRALEASRRSGGCTTTPTPTAFARAACDRCSTPFPATSG